MSRDFIGYGPVPLDFSWPDGSLVAVNLAINYETGAENSILDGDSRRERWTEYELEVPDGARDLTTESLYEYGSRRGIWRVLDVLDQHGVTASAFASGRALERNREVARAMAKRDYDFVGHGYRWRPPLGLTDEEERADIRNAKRVVYELTGYTMRGWFTRPPQTASTRRVLAEEGFLYDSDACNDDVPYFTPVLGRPFLVVPYSQDVNDGRFWRGQAFTAADLGRYAVDTVAVMLRQAPRLGPSMMTFALHPRIIGRPGRLLALDRFLRFACRTTGVWIAKRTAIADAWADAFAPADTWNRTPRAYTSTDTYQGSEL